MDTRALAHIQFYQAVIFNSICTVLYIYQKERKNPRTKEHNTNEYTHQLRQIDVEGSSVGIKINQIVVLSESKRDYGTYVYVYLFLHVYKY